MMSAKEREQLKIFARVKRGELKQKEAAALGLLFLKLPNAGGPRRQNARSTHFGLAPRQSTRGREVTRYTSCNLSVVSKSELSVPNDVCQGPKQ